jgi:hypothetical protein
VSVDIIGDPPHYARATIIGFSDVVIVAKRLTVRTLREISAAQALLVPDRLTIAVVSPPSQDVVTFARQNRMRLYMLQRHQPHPSDIFNISWDNHQFAFAPTMLAAELSSAANLDSTLVAEFGRPPVSLDDLGRRLLAEYGAGLDDTDSIKYDFQPLTRAVVTETGEPFQIESITFHVERTGREPSSIAIPADYFHRYRLMAADGRSGSFEVDMAMNGTALLDRSPAGIICIACWKRMPLASATAQSLDRSLLRAEYLLNVPPVETTDTVLICSSCLDAVRSNDHTRLSGLRLNAAVACMNVDIFAADTMARHLQAIHAAITGDESVYDDRSHSELPSESNIQACERSLRLLAENATTRDLYQAVSPALRVSSEEAALRFGMSSPWAQYEYLCDVLATVSAPETTNAFSPRDVWYTRMLLESLVGSHLQSFGIEAHIDGSAEPDPQRSVLIDLYLNRYASAPPGTLRYLIELLFNQIVDNPQAAAQAFPKLPGDAIFRALLWLQYQPEILKHQDAIACLPWAIRAFAAAQKNTYLRLSAAARLESFSISDTELEAFASLLSLDRGSRTHDVSFDAKRETRRSPIVRGEDGTHFPPPFPMLLHALLLRLDDAMRTMKGYHRKGYFFERMALAGLNVFSDLRVTHNFIVGVAKRMEKDILVLAGDVVLCIEVKSGRGYRLDRHRGDAFTLIQQRYKESAGDALRQARELHEFLDDPKNSSGFGLPAHAQFVEVALTVEDFGKLAMQPRLTFGDDAPACVTISIEEFGRIGDSLALHGFEGRDFGRFLLQHARFDYSSVVDDRMDLVLAFKQFRGHLPDPGNACWPSLRGRGVHFVDKTYADYFSQVEFPSAEHVDGGRPAGPTA